VTARQKRVLAAIQALELANPENEITPRSLWESARDADHPLHDEFEWDDSVAAAAHRDEQARRLLRLRVTVTHEERIIDAPICVRKPDAPADTAGYVRTTKLLDDKEQARRALVEEIERASRAVERARLVGSALGLTDECDTLLESLLLLKQRAAA
jgi:hypothetical protein